MTRKSSTGRLPRGSAALHALTSSALALGGIAGSAKADSPPEQATVGYSFTYYKEDDADDIGGGDEERYEIEMHQMNMLFPLFERWDLGFDLAYETMSGASPWFIRPDATTNEPIQVMSGATISDRRADLLMSTNRYFDNGKLGASVGISQEKDYKALNWGFSGERHFFNKNLTLSTGLGFSKDEIEATDADLFTQRPQGTEDKDSFTFFFGASQILNRVSTLQASVTWKKSDGYLSDPYKLAFVNGITLADSRPDDRSQWAFLLRYRRAFERFGGALHADYRYAWDDWDIKSHMLEVAWHQPLFRGMVRLIPSVRYYSQGEADFYAPFYTAPRADGLYSSDYRLSAYGALALGLRAETTFHAGRMPLTFALALERYISEGDLSLADVDEENPGLVDWWLLSAQLGAAF